MRHNLRYHTQFRRWRPSGEGEAGPEEIVEAVEIVAVEATEVAKMVGASPKMVSQVASQMAKHSSSPQTRQGHQGPGTEVPSIRTCRLESGPDVEFIINTGKMRTLVLNQRLVHGKMCMFQDNENLTSSVKIQTFIHYTKTTNFKK